MNFNWKKNTAVFLASQAISLLGSSLVQYAIMWYIMLSTKSGAVTTLAILCGFVPTFLLSPFAGVWADRYSRKKLIVLADGGIALATLLLALLWMGGVQQIWLLLVVMGVRALGGAVQQPCINAMLPDMVPSEHLTRVNGLFGTLNSLITLVSPLISGALMGFVSLHSIFLIDVVTAALAITILMLFLKLPTREKAEKPAKTTYWLEMKQGIGYIIKTPFLRIFFTACSVMWLCIGPVCFLTPLQVARNYGDDVWRLSMLEMGLSGGMLVGGLLISVWGGLKNRIHTVGLSGAMLAVITLILGVPLPFWLYISLSIVFGVALPMFNTPVTVLLQERVDPNFLGRVFSIMTMLSSSLMPMGMMAFGPLADKTRIEYLLVFTGLVIAGICFALLRSKPLLEAGKPLPAAAAHPSE